MGEIFHWEKWNFEPIGNSAHTAELAIGKALLCNADDIGFSEPTNPYLTLHKKWSNPIHMQYVIIAWLLKGKIQNEL